MDEDEAKIRSNDWPHWPVLAVINLKRGPEEGTGILVAWQRTVVYRTNIFDLQAGPLHEQLRGLARDTYASIEELIADGWVPD